ncbi:MAG: hypothetical protein JJE50_01455 [Actinomycetales bacterium]|nr:hypothetical protein [Actinomycetales bacterium]
MPTIIVLTEDGLREGDVTNILKLHDDPETSFEVLVPADTERHVLADLINHLSLLELREAWDSITHKETDEDARQDASEALERSLSLFAAAGATAHGTVVTDDPLPALRQAINNLRADEIIVVTRPHAVEDTFHQDWASRAREELGIPVLHFYTGTSLLG